ncbi:hypothetical protein Tco_1563542 [Tanacetum coccineum]
MDCFWGKGRSTSGGGGGGSDDANNGVDDREKVSTPIRTRATRALHKLAQVMITGQTTETKNGQLIGNQQSSIFALLFKKTQKNRSLLRYARSSDIFLLLEVLCKKYDMLTDLDPETSPGPSRVPVTFVFSDSLPQDLILPPVPRVLPPGLLARAKVLNEDLGVSSEKITRSISPSYRSFYYPSRLNNPLADALLECLGFHHPFIILFV